jgi:hypothetical protein
LGKFFPQGVKRQVQRRAKSASVSKPTLRVRCNVCYAPMLKHKFAIQTKNADLQQTFAKQDKTNKLKQQIRAFIEAKPKFPTTD